jgi:hypothetical protein
MLKYVFVFVILIAAAAHIVSSRVDAQTPSLPPLASPFNPSFGDLMNTLVQPRHAKLGLIGREQNWVLAAYEVHQLKAALTNIGIWRPRFRDQSVSELMEAMTGEPIRALEAAVQASDLSQFARAYDRLTEGCNSCHAALGHGYVVIQVPDQSYFANQAFRVAR